MNLETRVTRLENATGGDCRSILVMVMRDGEDRRATHQRTLRELAERGQSREDYLPAPVFYVGFTAERRV